jgi:tryptophan-rich sensory protein
MMINKGVFHLFAAAAGILSCLFSLRMGEVFATLRLPLFFPPVRLLPVGWTVALICLSVSASGQTGGKKSTQAFFVSLGLTVLGAILFFRAGAPLASSVCGLLLLGVWLRLRRLLGEGSRRAMRLMTFCCCWAGYLTYINIGIWLLNI